MATVRDLSGNNPIDLKYSPFNRTAADLSAILALTPLYPGEVVTALNTGRHYRATGPNTWGLIGPVTSVVAGVLPQPSVVVTRAAGQSDPATVSPIQFTVQFTQDVTGFVTGDVSFAGSTAGGTLVGAVGGGPNLYTVTVTGMTTTGSVIVSVPAGVATGAGGTNLVSNSTTVQWVVDTQRPSVTINKHAAQDDPTSTSPILYTIVFDEPVAGFIASDITLTGPGPVVGSLSGSGANYTFSVTGMNADGDVTALIPANVCQDAAGNLNFASTSADNIVQWIQPVTPPAGVTQTYFYMIGQY